MERENLFIVLSVILMLVIAIYEAMSTGRGSLVFGKHFMAEQVEEFTDDTINGTSLPPIIDYKKALYHSLYRAINTAADAAAKQEQQKKNNVRAMLRDFQGYYSKAYIRYIFNLNTSGKLTHNLLPKSFPVDLDDLRYYMSTYGLADYIGYIQRAPLPKYGDAQFTGPLVSAIYSEANGNNESYMVNTLTGDQIEITEIQYNRLKEIYTGPPDLFNNMAYTVLYVYFNLGSLGNNGSVPIGLIDNTYIELFGSPLNTQQRYCSPFQFEVDYFSSLGNFFTYRLSPGQKYTCNPPYSDSLLTETAKRLISELQRNGPQSSIDIFMLIPVWDREGKILCGSNGLNRSSNEMNKNANDPNERFRCLELLRSSGYIRAEKILRKDDHKYYSWFGDKFISYCHTYAIVLSTSTVSKIDLDNILKKWDTIVYGPSETIPLNVTQINEEYRNGSSNLVLEDDSDNLE